MARTDSKEVPGVGQVVSKAHIEQGTKWVYPDQGDPYGYGHFGRTGDDSSTSFSVNSRTLMDSKGGRRTPSVSSRGAAMHSSFLHLSFITYVLCEGKKKTLPLDVSA